MLTPGSNRPCLAARFAQAEQKGKNLTWKRMQKQMMKWIPTARELRPYPNQPFCV